MRALLVVAVVAAICLTAGCAGFARAPVVPGYGFIYSDFASPLQVDYNKAAVSSKMGEAVCEDVLGWVAVGDASVHAAAASKGITQINTVDYKFWNILGIYSKFTTVVYGD